MEILRDKDKISPMVCSATVIEVDSGAFTTIIPRSVAACTSTLSTPTPALAIIFSLDATSITSLVTFVLLLTIIPSKSLISFTNSFGVISVRTITSATSSNSSIPFWFI